MREGVAKRVSHIRTGVMKQDIMTSQSWGLPSSSRGGNVAGLRRLPEEPSGLPSMGSQSRTRLK